MTNNRTNVAILFTLFVLIPQHTMAQPEIGSSRFTTSDGVELHYLEAGSGPALVFVPGWTMPASIWEPQIRHFAATHRVVALDPRGHGRSDKPAFGYHPSRRARDIGELLEHLGGDPVVVVGWSLGVQEVLVYAQEFGNQALRAAVLVDHPVDLGPPEEVAAVVTPRIESLQTEREEWTKAFVEAIHGSPQPEEYFESLTRAVLSMPTNAAVVVSANVLHLGPTDLGSALESLDRPALFVFSSLDWALDAADQVRTGWPEIGVEVIDGTSHALFVDNPEAFNRVLENFIATLPE